MTARRGVTPLSLLLVISLAAGCGRAAGPDPVPPAEIPASTEAPASAAAQHAPVEFGVSSLESTFFAFAGTFEGSYTVQPDGLDVFVRRATVRLRYISGNPGPRHLSALRLGLGYGDTTGSWRIPTRSEPVRIDRDLRPGEEVTLESLHFRVPVIERDADLRRNWIVFEMESLRPGPFRPSAGVATAYAHSLRMDGSPP